MGIVARVVAGVIGQRVRLPESLVSRFPELDTAVWRVGGLPPRIGGWCLGTRTVAGITLWRTVFLARGTPLDPALLLHEFRHVQQFEASPAFPVLYLWESLARGYRRNRYEADAQWYAGERLRGAEPPIIPSSNA